jgi:hypothetical protein
MEKPKECDYEIKESAESLRNTVQDLTHKLHNYERVFSLIYKASNLMEVCGILESFKLSSGWIPFGPNKV